MDTTVSKEERTWAMVAHLSALAMYVTGIGHVLGPLIVWLVKRDGNPFVEEQAREALNFQISVTIYGAIAVVLIFTVVLSIVAIPFLVVLHVTQIVCLIIGAIRANDGQLYRYPFNLRLVKGPIQG